MVGDRVESPGIDAGRGLKQRGLVGKVEQYLESPGIDAGRGLKQLLRLVIPRCLSESPGIDAGRGLKPLRFYASSGDTVSRPALMPGVD